MGTASEEIAHSISCLLLCSKLESTEDTRNRVPRAWRCSGPRKSGGFLGNLRIAHSVA
jgi:hypothetical protein